VAGRDGDLVLAFTDRHLVDMDRLPVRWKDHDIENAVAVVAGDEPGEFGELRVVYAAVERLLATQGFGLVRLVHAVDDGGADMRHGLKLQREENCFGAGSLC
jgi:hypothetical protein